MLTHALVLWAALSGASPPAVFPGGLAAAVAQAWKDLSILPAPQATTARYAWLGNLPPNAQIDATAALSLVLNSVSRASLLTPPTPLAGSLWRFHLLDYAPAAADLRAWELAYEELAALDPYLSAAMVHDETLDQLRLVTGSRAPVVRGDWLVWKLSAPPHYYRFAGIPATRREYEVSLGLDADALLQLGAARGANLFLSGVTHKPRRISRWQGPLGGAWNTYDVLAAVADRDPFRDPTDGFRFDAGEHIGAKANGLHLFALYDAVGKRADAVPDQIAKDDSDPRADGIIRPMISCVRCHVEDGLRGFVNDQRRLATAGVVTSAESPQAAQDLALFYSNDKLPRQMDRDREDYARSVSQATGMSAAAAARALALTVRRYAYEPVTPRVAAAELGLTSTEDLTAALARSTDPILLALAAGVEVERQQWEVSFPGAAVLVISSGTRIR